MNQLPIFVQSVFPNLFSLRGKLIVCAFNYYSHYTFRNSIYSSKDASMTNKPKFCTQCGAPLEIDQKFCTQCGASVAASIDTSNTTQVMPSADSAQRQYLQTQTANTTENKQAASSSIAPQATCVMPQEKAAPKSTSYGANSTYVSSINEPNYHTTPTDSTSYTQTMPSAPSMQQKSSNTKRNILIAIIVVVVIAILIGLLVSSGLNNQPSNQTSSAQTAQNSEPDTNKNTTENNTDSNSSSNSKVHDSIYNDLLSYYNKLENYDSRISNAASDFNNNYLQKSTSTRESYSKTASNLYFDIVSDYESIRALDISSAPEYGETYNKILTCYYDCKMRIDVIREAWANSLGYSDPTGHEDDICEPLKRDRVGDNNKYYTEFKETYPQAKPTK